MPKKNTKGPSLCANIKPENHTKGPSLCAKLSAALEAVFPSNIYCMCCGSYINETREYGLCDNCLKKFHWIRGNTCHLCGKALPENYIDELCYDCRMYGHDFRRGYSVLTYGLYERAVILDFKYSSKPWLGRYFGRMMHDRIEFLRRQGEIIDFDLIVPVPVHGARMDSRGYNQAALLAREFGRLQKVPVRESVLARHAATTAMKGLDMHSRRMNVKNAFRINPGASFMIENRHVLLIDDIFTTGSTADSCAVTLLAAGAASVDVFCLASGVNRPPRDEFNPEHELER